MCQFFSCVSNGKGKIYYFDWKQRKEFMKENLNNYSHDSHSSICAFFNLNEDKMNKYEYNPLTNQFKIDQINNVKDDSILIENQMKDLDFKTIVKPLIIKKIINPFLDVEQNKFTDEDLNCLKEWNSVVYSVRNSIRCSVWYSVRNSVWDSVRGSVVGSVWDSVVGSVWDSVGYSVENSVGYSVCDSVENSVRDSIWSVIWCYISSFFNIKYEYNFDSVIKLWERGFVPSFDGTTWRIHQGEDANIIFEISKDELEK